MSTPDLPRDPDRARDKQRHKDELPDVNRPDEVDEIPGLGLPTEDVELDDRPPR
jgi:hypothetical protein